MSRKLISTVVGSCRLVSVSGAYSPTPFSDLRDGLLSAALSFSWTALAASSSDAVTTTTTKLIGYAAIASKHAAAPDGQRRVDPNFLASRM